MVQLKLTRKGGYQKLPTDQELHVFGFRKSPVDKRLSPHLSGMSSDTYKVAQEAHHCSASRIRVIRSCNLDRNPLAGCPCVGKVEISCSIFWWYCRNSSTVDITGVNPLGASELLILDRVSGSKLSVSKRTAKYPTATLWCTSKTE